MDSDTVQAFLVEACVLDEGSRSERTELYSRYEKYCEDTNRQSLTKNNFYKSLRVKGYKDFKSGSYRYFKGISDEKSSPTPAPKTAQDGFMTIPVDYQEKLPFG